MCRKGTFWPRSHGRVCLHASCQARLGRLSSDHSTHKGHRPGPATPSVRSLVGMVDVVDFNVFETANAGFAQAMYEEFLRDPSAVGPEWRRLFESGVVGERPEVNGAGGPRPATTEPRPAVAAAMPAAPAPGPAAAALPPGASAIKGP